jgi:hypothetical protein
MDKFAVVLNYKKDEMSKCMPGDIAEGSKVSLLSSVVLLSNILHFLRRIWQESAEKEGWSVSTSESSQ